MLFFRYEDEINKRNESENTFVLIKKVCIHSHILDLKTVISLLEKEHHLFLGVRVDCNSDCYY